MMPTAGGVPPAEQTSDPVTPGAVCSDWHLESDYGDRWATDPTTSWWEYQCTYHTDASYYPDPCPGGGMCDAGWWCWGYPFDCFSSTEDWTDSYYWDESNSTAVFYGQSYTYTHVTEYGESFSDDVWWDAAAAQWYSLVPRHVLAMSTAGAGSGTLTASPGGISCTGTCQTSFPAGSVVGFSAVPDTTFMFGRWSGDCTGTGPCLITMDRDRSVTAEFAVPPPPNVVPIAAFTTECEGLNCRFDAGDSLDPDGSIVAYRWHFGDGTSATGRATEHIYAVAGRYPVELIVTDNRGSFGTNLTLVTVSDPPPSTWNLAADFGVTPNQANPAADRSGNPGVWRYLEGASLVHTPATYRRLENFITDRLFVEGLQSWQGTVVSLDARTDRLPSVSLNARADNPYPYGIDWPAGALLVHPLSNQVVVVGWTSPISGTVQVTGGVADRHTACGDGIDWSVDKGDVTLVSGPIPNGGAQSFFAAPGSANLDSIAVGRGDVLYFVVGPGASGDHRCDSTGLDVRIRPIGTVATINSFTPSGGPVGTSVDVVGADFSTATAVTFDGTNARYTVESDSQIHASVPAGTSTGAISVTTPDGTAFSHTAFAVTGAAPAINSFTPTSGPPGTLVAIAGAGFTDATAITFNHTPAIYTVDSDSMITATVPASATAGPISVTTPNGTAASPTTFTATLLPTVTGFSPQAAATGTTVDIQGRDLAAATSISFNGTPASYIAQSPTNITATVPNGATTGAITVTTPTGTAISSSAFTVIPPPTVTGFSPSSGYAGRQVAITGSHLTTVTAVKLGTTAASFTVTSPTEITAVVPTVARGYYKWSITTVSGVATSTGTFRVR